MARAISKWVSDKYNLEREQKIPRKLLLPRRPRRIITPSSSCVDLNPLISDNRFFRMLPMEIRRRILIEAFGNQTLHMDLSFEDPIAFHKWPPARSRHPHANSTIPQPKRKSKLAISKPKIWRWWSCVCHRTSPDVMGTHEGEQPWEDRCRQGLASYCFLWTDNRPNGCFIGATGWILSCRQAYMEGIDVLYSTNTFHMANNTMISNLSKILLPQRLESITSVEILLHLRLSHSSKPTRFPHTGFPAFQKFLQRIPSIFPNLKKLYFGLQGYMGSTKKDRNQLYDLRHFPIKSRIVELIDSMIYKMELQSCTVALPTNLYHPLYKRTARKLLDMGLDIGSDCERFWRELPEMETQNDDSTSKSKGYWLCLGQTDEVWKHNHFDYPYYPFRNTRANIRMLIDKCRPRSNVPPVFVCSYSSAIFDDRSRRGV